MNRFQRPERRKILRKLLPLVFFLLILILFLGGLSSISRITTKNEEESLKKSILQGAVHCYATEGFYPDSLDYLTKHYGIQYDSEKYIIFYEIIGSNLMPDVRIIPRQEQKGDLS
ncbi:MAG: hypothetical protein SO415_02640 [Oliverpabstia sp.]|nr:hypothetical protein [Oliverpabstia sp.]